MRYIAQEVLDILAEVSEPSEAFDKKKAAEKIYNNSKVKAEWNRLQKQWPEYNDNDEHAEEIVDKLDDFIMENGFLDSYSEDEAEEVRDEYKSMFWAGMT